MPECKHKHLSLVHDLLRDQKPDGKKTYRCVECGKMLSVKIEPYQIKVKQAPTRK
jgi:uncharacterized Zn finger protein